MQGLTLQINDNNQLQIIVEPSEVRGVLDAKTLITFVTKSKYSDLVIFEDKLLNVVALYNESKNTNSTKTLTEVIGERQNADIKFRISDDSMSAFVTVTAPQGGEPASFEDLSIKAKHSGIVRGLSTKRLKMLAEWCETAKPGDTNDELIAKGLPAKNGRMSRVKPLVPNALERILKPQKSDNNKVNMRNLGDIICVKVGTKLLQRIPPTDGRAGYTVTGAEVEPQQGKWVDLDVSEGTEISPEDDNYLIAAIDGMPKFKDGRMWVDDTYICSGVNVGSGNIKYDGAVLVNGDVTENMQIEAEGDVTINGFVESARIIAKGDIIITEGAMGKVSGGGDIERTTHLISQGSVHVQHGQGINIECKGNVTIGRQLAYSQIKCNGSVTVGDTDKPSGTLFSCKISCHKAVTAGTLGAVSGSQLSIDYSDGYNDLLKRREILDNLVNQLGNTVNRHKGKISEFSIDNCPPHLRDKLEQFNMLVDDETRNHEWLLAKLALLQREKDEYADNLKVTAYNKIFPGVSIKLNTKVWRAEREYRTALIAHSDHIWNYEPL
ncbi:DUF342 domain-containing protein [Alteromonadaceae bacterium M269]|nr:DUF342 domain-containing protein [Alteromonadaceae bacterium M269]